MTQPLIRLADAPAPQPEARLARPAIVAKGVNVIYPAADRPVHALIV